MSSTSFTAAPLSKGPEPLDWLLAMELTPWWGCGSPGCWSALTPPTRPGAPESPPPSRPSRGWAPTGHPLGLSPLNLAPAELKKDAGAFDLPIALAMLVATDQLPAERLDQFAIAGELALDGSVRPV